MRIVCVSDTHRQHRAVEIPEGDLLIYAGDIACARESEPILTQDFNEWLAYLPCKWKVVIAGNHDAFFEKEPKLARSTITNAFYLENNSIEIEGMKIWGSPYTPFFCDWSFGATVKEIDKIWQGIPEDTNILVTHGPPFGILDILSHPQLDIDGMYTWSGGCHRLRERLLLLKEVKLHVFGHIHEGYGKRDIYVNASIVDENYRLKNKPIVVNI